MNRCRDCAFIEYEEDDTPVCGLVATSMGREKPDEFNLCSEFRLRTCDGDLSLEVLSERLSWSEHRIQALREEMPTIEVIFGQVRNLVGLLQTGTCLVKQLRETCGDESLEQKSETWLKDIQAAIVSLQN